MSRVLRGYLCIIAAAVIWATLGPICRLLIEKYQFASLTLPFLRAGLAALALLAWMVVIRRDLLRAPAGSWPLLLAFGIVGVGFFYWSLIKAVELSGVAMAVTLMYTAPAWTAVGGALFLREPFTVRKLLALMMALAGAALVAKAYDPELLRLSLWGVLAGLGASLGYSAFSLFTKMGAGKIDARTMSLYGFGLGALVLLPFQSAIIVPSLKPGALLLIAAMVAGPTLGSWLLFSRGLRDVPVSNALITASIEPVIAGVLAWAMFGETLAPLQLAGVALILAAVTVLQVRRHGDA